MVLPKWAEREYEEGQLICTIKFCSFGCHAVARVIGCGFEVAHFVVLKGHTSEEQDQLFYEFWIKAARVSRGVRRNGGSISI